jgi:hypothetical protein
MLLPDDLLTRLRKARDDYQAAPYYTGSERDAADAMSAAITDLLERAVPREQPRAA